MKTSLFAAAFAVASVVTTGAAFGQSGTTASLQQPYSMTPAPSAFEYASQAAHDLQQPSSVTPAPSAFEYASQAAPGLQQPSSVTPAPSKFEYASQAAPGLRQPASFTPSAFKYANYGTDACNDDGCDDGCGCGDDYGCGDSCCDCGLGEEWSLHDELTPCCDTYYGGWFQIGYHSDLTGLSQEPNDLLDFNDLPNQLNLHQAWLYVGKDAEAECCSADYGYRYDILYGTDAQSLQAFGNPRADVIGRGAWDASFDHGEYGWAMPQAYLQAAYGDWSVIVGKFITILGFEYVESPKNFFYSHSLAYINSEPFSHTGVLTTYNLNDTVKVYNGWTLGWDTGFEQNFNGSNYLGGVEVETNDNVTMAYILTAGNFGYRSAGRSGYSHGAYIDAEVSDSLEYAIYTVYVDTNGSYGVPTTEGQDVGITNYLFYTLNDCWALGGRVEWWKSNTTDFTNAMTSFYELTGGINYMPCPNLVIRPEIRYDWTPSAVANDYNRTIFGIDMVLTY